MKTIKLEKVFKSYKKNIILNQASYEFKPGNIHMIIGVNGVGKTTLIKAILGLISFDGTIEVPFSKIEYVPEKFIFPDFVTVSKFIQSLLAIKKNNINDEYFNTTLKEWGLGECINKKVSKLSKGMRQKVLLLQALICDSEVYILDEPINGLDKVSQLLFINKLNKMRNEKRIIIITSHYPEIYKDIVDVNVYLEEGKLHD